MKFLAMTQSTAEWILPKVNLIDALHDVIIQFCDDGSDIYHSDFVDGSVGIFQDPSGKVIALVNEDYLDHSGEEVWGFIKISGDFSLSKVPLISRECLERSIYVINQRLRGLLIDGAYYHKKYPNGSHTLLAGRGSAARNYSIGYFETVFSDRVQSVRYLISLGPSEIWGKLSDAAAEHAALLPNLFDCTTSILSGSKKGAKLAPSAFPELRSALANYRIRNDNNNEYQNVEVTTGIKAVDSLTTHKSIGLNYDEWLDSSSSLNDAQRRILNSDVLENHPLRIIGPAGSGKTLLMQLIAIRLLRQSKERGDDRKILYVVHSEAMRDKIYRRFQVLDPPNNGTNIGESRIYVSTLAEYCRQELQLAIESVLERDASDAKAFQLETIKTSIMTLKDRAVKLDSPLISSVYTSDQLFQVFAILVMAEISIAIKGRGLEADPKGYIESDRALSRFHKMLTIEERRFLFEIFSDYHQEVFETYGVLDPDDIALSLSGRLRTPVWQLRRKSEGFDYVLVDEAQLFNENERRVLPLLTRANRVHVPIALALDEAQAFYGQSKVGLNSIGLKDVTSENLQSVHRSTSTITKLAFFVIQRSTDLFGPDFPAFDQINKSDEIDKHPLAGKPKVEIESKDSPGFSKFVLRRVRELRRENTRQIAIVCHAEIYWSVLENELSKIDLPFQILRERGERIRADQPVVVLCRPEQVGGQEFDSVIIVGLELGVVPPRIRDNEALGAALEQQSVRETYLSITRARYRVIFCISHGATPNTLVSDARNAGLIS